MICNTTQYKRGKEDFETVILGVTCLAFSFFFAFMYCLQLILILILNQQIGFSIMVVCVPLFILIFLINKLIQRLKTRVIKRDVNPQWNEELTLSITSLETPIILVSNISLIWSPILCHFRCAIAYATKTYTWTKVIENVSFIA